MAHFSNSGDVAHATSFHVKDCYVWSEIYYLDSATDYREYLPKNVRHSGFGELILLESAQSFFQHLAIRLSSIRARLVTFLLGCLAFALLMGIAVESF